MTTKQGYFILVFITVLCIFGLLALPILHSYSKSKRLESGETKEEMLELCLEKDCFKKLIIQEHYCYYDYNFKEKCKHVDTFFSVKGFE